MWRLVGAAAALLVLTSAVSAAPGGSPDVLSIVPGRAIGRVELGMTPTLVAARLGIPTRADWSEDILRWTYDMTHNRYGHLDVYFAYEAHQLVAVQVLTRTGGRYALWDGSQVGSPFGAFLLLAGEPDAVDRLGMAIFRLTYYRLGIGFITVASPEGAIIVGIAVFAPQRAGRRGQA